MNSSKTKKIAHKTTKTYKQTKKKNIPIATVIGGGYSNDNFELAERPSLIFYAANQVFNQKI